MSGGIDIGTGYGIEPIFIGYDFGQEDLSTYTYWIDKDLAIFTDKPLTGEELEAMKQNPDLVRKMLVQGNYQKIKY